MSENNLPVVVKAQPVKRLVCNDCGDGVGDCGDCGKEVKLNEPVLCIEWGDDGHVHFLCAVKSWSDNIAKTEMEEEDDLL